MLYIIKKTGKSVNRSIIILLLLGCLYSCGNRAKTDAADGVNVEQSKDNANKKLPFKQGSYVEESTVMGINVQKTIYFDNWGEWTATEDKSEMKMGGMTIKTHNLEIVKGKTHWQMDLLEKTGTKFELNIPDGMATAMAAAVAGEMMEGMEVKNLGEEKYLGYNCKKIQVKYTQMNMETTVLTYGNLTMKMEGKMGGMDISTKITSISLNAPPASIFEVPAGVKIEDVKY